MDLNVDIEEDVVVMTPRGDLVYRTTKELHQEWTRLVQEGNTKFILNMEGVGILSSAGVRELVVLSQHVEEKGGGLCLVGLTTQATELFEVARLGRELQIAGSVDEAKSRFA